MVNPSNQFTSFLNLMNKHLLKHVDAMNKYDQKNSGSVPMIKDRVYI